MLNIDTIYKMIDWNNDSEVQSSGIGLARSVPDISLFVQPDGYKWIWENCVIILSEKSDKELEPYLIPLLQWLQDMNWPGAIRIHKRLKSLSSTMISQPLQLCIDSAIAQQNEEWLYNLSGFSDCRDFLESLPLRCKEILLKRFEERKEFWQSL